MSTQRLSRGLVPRVPSAAGALLVASLLAGCGGSGSTHKNTQVVATVNDKEITVSQLDLALQNANVESVTPAAAQQAIDSLVNEELLVQDAMKNNLDRDPAVVQAIEHARRQVLAQSFADRKLFARTAPTDAQVGEYYRKNPMLFENRKIYRFTAFTVSKADLTPGVRADLDQAHVADKVREALEKHAIGYTTQIATIVPEQLVSDRLKDFADAHVGDLLMWDKSEGKELLMSLTAIEDSPVSLAQATPMIRQYLVNASRKDALETYLKQSKAVAKIAYIRDVTSDPALGNPGGEAGAGGGQPADPAQVIKDGIAGLN